MPDVQLFTNKPSFCQKNLSVNETLNLSHFDVLAESNASTSSYARCGDPLLQTLFIRNVVHKLIRCGGERIDLNFVLDMFPASDPTRVSSKRWFNHYNCDPDFNIYSSNAVTSATAGGAITFNLLKANHGGGGELSIPAPGFIFFDKDNMIQYTITNVDTTTNYSHRITITPNDTTVYASIKTNTAYLVIPARMIGGCSCPIITNSMASLGYVQELNPIRLRRDWKLCIDLLTGYEDKIQYAVTYDMQGNPVDSWDVKEAQDMRLGLRMALNIIALIGSPTTNASLISGVGATIDSLHTGFYGIVPTIQYGGGNVYDYRADQGFDLEADGEPIFLYQDSRKRTKKFMVWHGQKFRFNLIDRTNKLVARTDLGKNEWEAFRRAGAVDLDGNTGVEKLGVDMYKYQGFQLDFKKIDAFSDYRYFGSDRWNGTAIFMPQDGATENGRPLQPVEFYNYGVGQWTGDYYEQFIDFRKTTGCEEIGGYATESIGMGVHCPDQWILANPIKPV